MQPSAVTIMVAIMVALDAAASLFVLVEVFHY
jgi:hypothetical protein